MLRNILSLVGSLVALAVLAPVLYACVVVAPLPTIAFAVAALAACVAHVATCNPE